MRSRSLQGCGGCASHVPAGQEGGRERDPSGLFGGPANPQLCDALPCRQEAEAQFVAVARLEREFWQMAYTATTYE